MVGRTLVKGGPLANAGPELSLLPRLPSLPEAEDVGCPKAAVWCAEHFLPGVGSSQRQAMNIWRRTKNSYEHTMIVQVLRGKVLRLHFCMAFVVVRAVHTHAPRAE